MIMSFQQPVCISKGWGDAETRWEARLYKSLCLNKGGAAPGVRL
jgi:hypothetical protein